jgi:hypothetical protein
MASVDTLLCFCGPFATPGAIGLNAVKRARMAGLTDDQIKQMVTDENLKVGDDAKEALGLA